MTERTRIRSGATYKNIVLTLICAFLGVIALRETGGLVTTAEGANNTKVPMIPNAAAQRVQMIEELRELRTISGHLESMESKMDSRLTAIERSIDEMTVAFRVENKRRGRTEESE